MSRPTAPDLQKRIRAAKVGMVADGFQRTLARHGLPRATPEHRIVEGRKFAWDWAWPEQKVCLEVQGGNWARGAHARGAGLLRDYEKLNLATCQGWRCLMVTPDQLCSPETMTLLDQVLRGTR